MRPTRMTLMLLTLVGALTLTTAAPVLAGGGGAVCDGFSNGDHIRMYDSCFAGTAQLVDADTDTVTISNDGMVAHTITATDDSFDLYVPAGESATLELPAGGVIPVYCTLHGTAAGEGMAGVIVRDDGTAPTGVTTASGGETAAGDETAAPGELAAFDAPIREDDGDGLAVVAIVVAAVAAAVALVAAVGAHRAVPARSDR